MTVEPLNSARLPLSGGSRVLRFWLLIVGLAGTAGAQPRINAVVNNSSFLPAGFPSFGIAQGSLFAITGNGLGPEQAPSLPDLSQAPLSTGLQGVSVSITVNGTTVDAPLYYVSSRQIAGVLRSNTPLGTGSISVSYKGQTSDPLPITVVGAAFGISSGVLNASNSYGYVTPISAARPGETIILWGTGLGASAGDETRFPFPQVDLQSNARVKVYIGGQEAAVAYAGRSQFPAVDQINVVIPQGVAGCNVAVLVQTGNFVSNTGKIAVAPSGRTCSDPAITGLSVPEFENLLSKETIRAGSIELNQTVIVIPTSIMGGVVVGSTGSGSGFATALFARHTAFGFSASSGKQVSQTSLGSCSTYQQIVSTEALQLSGLDQTVPRLSPAAFLNAGTLTMKTPVGNDLVVLKNPAGYYSLQASAQTAFFIPDNGTFNFTSTASSEVGPLTNANIAVPAALTWRNRNTTTTVLRSEGLAVVWDGNDRYPGIVSINGLSSMVTGSSEALVTSFSCTAPFSAGRFTVPPYVLLSMLPTVGVSSDRVSLSLTSPPASFTSPSLDYSALTSTATIGTVVRYQ